MAQDQGAEIINFSSEDPVEAIRELTDGIGVDRAVDAVGVDANRASKGPAHDREPVRDREKDKEFDKEVQKIAPQRKPQGGNWNPGAAPSQALQWAVEALAKAGTLSIIGVYPETAQTFPIGMAMNKNLSIRMGNCNHRKYIPKLVDMIRTDVVNPSSVLTNLEPLTSAIEAYKLFDRREPGWIKVELLPAA
jgi:threonine dehydrogenase-like Zn-dependent dehydrogenase